MDRLIDSRIDGHGCIDGLGWIGGWINRYEI